MYEYAKKNQVRSGMSIPSNSLNGHFSSISLYLKGPLVCYYMEWKE